MSIQVPKFNTSEIFSSIQGEGFNSGKPSTFIRLFGCNYSCSFCDAWYTVPKLLVAKKQIPKYTPLEIEQIVDRVLEYGNNHIVITGGEPLINQYLFDLVKALRFASPNIKTIEIETNCSLIPPNALDALIDYYDVSPKTSNSGMSKKERIVPVAIEWFNRRVDKAFFKFVVANESDIEEINRDFIIPFSILPERVFLMPEGIDKETILDRSVWLVGQCKKYGYRYSSRLHILLYGNVRGT